MKWISIADLVGGHARERVAEERREIEFALAQARMDQSERHHAERLEFDREKMEIQAASAARTEKSKGENALAELTRKHMLEQAAKSSSLLDDAWLGIVREGEESNKVFSDAMRQILVIDANLVAQERLRCIDHVHASERLRLENDIQDKRQSHDRLLEIVVKLLERELGLEGSQVDETQLDSWVREAMQQAGEV